MQITKKAVLFCVFLESKTFTHLHDIENPAVFFTYIKTITKSTSRLLRVTFFQALLVR